MAWPDWGSSSTSAGPRLAGTGADDAGAGTVAWTNPGNITAEDAVFAEVSLTVGSESHYLKATNFGFAIPSNAQVDGIVCEIKAAVEALPSTVYKKKRIVKGGAISAGAALDGATSPFTTTFSWYATGDATEKWGETWLPANINAATFGYAFTVYRDTGDDPNSRCDAVRITVHYSIVNNVPWHGALLYALGLLAAWPLAGALARALQSALARRWSPRRTSQSRHSRRGERCPI